jgi:hypothetical protein
MTDSRQRVERAIRLTPPADRERYATEWRHDVVQAAEHSQQQAQDVARAATRMAVRLQGRRVEHALLGRRGIGVAVAAWVLLCALVIAALLFGGPVLLAVVVAFLLLSTALARAGAPSHWSHWLMIASVVTGIVSAAFVWWAAAAMVDAADALTPTPQAATWGGVGLMAFAASCVGLLGSAVMAVRRENSRRR